MRHPARLHNLAGCFTMGFSLLNTQGLEKSTTMNIYAHATGKAKRTSARLLDKVVGGKYIRLEHKASEKP